MATAGGVQPGAVLLSTDEVGEVDVPVEIGVTGCRVA